MSDSGATVAQEDAAQERARADRKGWRYQTSRLKWRGQHEPLPLKASGRGRWAGFAAAVSRGAAYCEGWGPSPLRSKLWRRANWWPEHKSAENAIAVTPVSGKRDCDDTSE